MFIIAEEDIGKVESVVGKVLNMLAEGTKRIDCDVELGDDLLALKVTGYWVNDIIRIDIKPVQL